MSVEAFPQNVVLREMREKLGISQKDLAARLSISPQYVNDLERGRRSTSPETAERLLNALNAPPEVAKALVEQWSGGWLPLFRKYAKIKTEGK